MNVEFVLFTQLCSRKRCLIVSVSRHFIFLDPPYLRDRHRGIYFSAPYVREKKDLAAGSFS